PPTAVLYSALRLNPYLTVPVSMLALFAVGVLLERTLVFRVVDAPELSSLLLTFGISIALVNLAQLLFTSDLRSVEYLTGSWVVGPVALSKPRLVATQPEIVQIWTFKSLLVIVLGGAGNYPGALLGGILLGLIEQVASLFLTTQLSEVVAYVLLVVVLLVRPTGLLGGRET